jgi:hypothetical protein
MNTPLCSHQDGIRKLHWYRIVLFSAVAPATIALLCIVGRLVARHDMSWPWTDGAFWAIASLSWGAFAGGLVRAAKSAPLETEITSASESRSAS